MINVLRDRRDLDVLIHEQAAVPLGEGHQQRIVVRQVGIAFLRLLIEYAVQQDQALPSVPKRPYNDYIIMACETSTSFTASSAHMTCFALKE